MFRTIARKKRNSTQHQTLPLNPEDIMQDATPERTYRAPRRSEPVGRGGVLNIRPRPDTAATAATATATATTITKRPLPTEDIPETFQHETEPAIDHVGISSGPASRSRRPLDDKTNSGKARPSSTGGWLSGALTLERAKALAGSPSPSKVPDFVRPFHARPGGEDMPHPHLDASSPALASRFELPESPKKKCVPRVDNDGVLVFSDDDSSVGSPTPARHHRTGRLADRGKARAFGSPLRKAHGLELSPALSPIAPDREPVHKRETERERPARPESGSSRGSASSASSGFGTRRSLSSEGEPVEAGEAATFSGASAGGRPDEVFHRCLIVRKNSGKYKFSPRYLMFIERPGEVPELLLMAKKQNMSKTTNYHLYDMRGTDPKADVKKDSSRYIGKLCEGPRGGTNFVLYGRGLSRKDLEGHSGVGSFDRSGDSWVGLLRPELCALNFKVPSLIKKLRSQVGPRSATVVFPRISKDGQKEGYRAANTDDSLVARVADGRFDDLIVMRTKEPTIINGVYQLNFGGRVKVASVKNFQLVPDDDIENVRIQFGKVSKDKFILDFKSPLSAAQAFAIGVSQFLA